MGRHDAGKLDLVLFRKSETVMPQSPVCLSQKTHFSPAHSLGEVVRKGVIERTKIRRMSADISQTFDVRLPNENPIASALSGGNLQKFVVGRDVLRHPDVFIVSQPTWGVDVGAALFIRKAMLDMAAAGSAIVMISQDLEEIFAISHRVAVLYQGSLSKVMVTADVTLDAVGLLMGGGELSAAMLEGGS